MRVRVILLVVVCLLPLVPALAKNVFGDSVVVSEPLDDDLYAAGGEVRIEGPIAGSAVLGAGTAVISGDVEGDVILAGGGIDVTGGVGDDFRAAGGNVRINGFVTDQATIAGGSVTLGSGSAIGGRTWIAAGNLDMAGQIGDDLRVAAGTVVISGRVAGNVEVAAREIHVEPGAVIGGDLVWRSRQPPVIAEDAQILGAVREAGEGEPRQGLDESGEGLAGGWALGVAAAVAALLLLWFAPQLAARSAAAFQTAPGRTLALGAASIVLTPIIAVVLFVTVVGWLVGLLVLAGYVFALILSGLLGLLIVVHLLRDRFGTPTARAGAGRNVAFLLLVVVVLVLAQRVPLLGVLLNMLLVLAGFGALTAIVTGRTPSPPIGTASPGS